MESPRFVGLLYGLLCVDIAGKEVLLPNLEGIGHHAEHFARIWFMKSAVSMGETVPEDATGTDGTDTYKFFDITEKSVTFKAFDAEGQELPDPATPLKKRNDPQHPWINFKWIRCLKKLTGLPLIGESDRNKRRLVTARVRLGTGTVSAFPPFNKNGQHGRWKVKQRGKTVVSATTDSMLWSRPLAEKTAKVRMTIAPLGKKSGWYVDLIPSEEDTVLLCAVTHALHLPDGQYLDPRKLVHTAAFAKLLKGGERFEKRIPFPIPELVGLAAPRPKQSTDDVHCECTSCP